MDLVKVLVPNLWRTRLFQTKVPQGHRDADPEGQLDPDKHTGLEGVAVVSDVELRDDTAQVLLKLEPEKKNMSVDLVYNQNKDQDMMLWCD